MKTFVIGMAVTLAIALGVFYAAFFKLAPFIASQIPAGDWHGLFVIAVYGLVAYLGGIGIPIVIIVIGFGISTTIAN